jgi:arylsulfatase A
LLGALRQSGLESNTIVIFSADNGPEFYAYARDEKFDHWSSAPFRGVKRDIYEGGHHVPFLIKWPGVTKAGTVTDALISQVDLMATFAALVNFDLPKNAAEDSHNFQPWLKGASKTPPRSTMVHNTYKDYAIRDGDWLLIAAASGYAQHKSPSAWNKKHQHGPDDDLPVELYNLKDDIGQKHNLASGYPDKVAELQALLKKIRDQGHSSPRLN